jgi:sugar-specific transcriptional regulator TrmB
LAHPATVTAMAEDSGVPIGQVQAALRSLAALGLVEAE